MASSFVVPATRPRRRPVTRPEEAGSSKETNNAGHGVRESHGGQREGQAARNGGVRGHGAERFTEGLVQAGILIAAAAPKTPRHAKRIVMGGSSRTVVDEPFADVRELVAGPGHSNFAATGHVRTR